ncbi:hypothetical protein BUALT_Bualt14G0003900 [Buddleja alternifolia]|uniref:MULE transposase domain-containing protein n=1 Tax=Buddleja alternifolia TaxID=168488 RepID=A0AAV6WLZ5_9LAMI|nr:hypothetical protein BUALT_Bualt14G0003900 [Buddleja alternifolia]
MVCEIEMMIGFKVMENLGGGLRSRQRCGLIWGLIGLVRGTIRETVGGNEENSDEKCSDFYDSEYVDTEVEGEKYGERVASVPTEIEPRPQPMPERKSSSNSGGEERDDLVHSGNNFISGKDSDREGGELDLVFNHRDKNDPKRNAGGFRQDVIQEIKGNVSQSQAYRAKRKAIKVTQGCRPVIRVDWCYLKGHYSGILLTTLSIDPNNSLYPIGYGVVSGTTKEAWECFFGLLKDDLGIERPDVATFIRDKERVLIPAFELVFPGAENRFFVRHLNENFKKARFRDFTFKLALWNAAAAARVPKYKLRIKEIRELDETSMECCILEAREKTILIMLEWIREYWMNRLIENRDRAKKSVEKSADYIPVKRWDLTGIPCYHAISAIGCQIVELDDFVHESYRVGMYLAAYNHATTPANGPKLWEKTGFIPPIPPIFGRIRERLARATRLGTNEPRDKAKRGHNEMGSKKRKTDIAAGLSRDFASPINANVENAIGNDARPFGKAPSQKKRTNVAWKRTFLEMEIANRLPKPIATPVLSQFRPPSVVGEPTPMLTPVPQPRVNIAPNHPILSESPIVNNQGGIPILIGRGEGGEFITMTNLSAVVF